MAGKVSKDFVGGHTDCGCNFVEYQPEYVLIK